MGASWGLSTSGAPWAMAVLSVDCGQLTVLPKSLHAQNAARRTHASSGKYKEIAAARAVRQFLTRKWLTDSRSKPPCQHGSGDCNRRGAQGSGAHRTAISGGYAHQAHAVRKDAGCFDSRAGPG